jgi:hypothetical protein
MAESVFGFAHHLPDRTGITDISHISDCCASGGRDLRYHCVHGGSVTMTIHDDIRTRFREFDGNRFSNVAAGSSDDSRTSGELLVYGGGLFHDDAQ